MGARRARSAVSGRTGEPMLALECRPPDPRLSLRVTVVDVLARRGTIGWALLFGALALAGCRREQIPPAPQWDAGPVDAGGPDYTDTDGDGVCDRTELGRGTDPTLADTDMDGFPDGVELRLGFDGTRTDSPERDLFVYLNEGPLATADMPILVTVRGNGETYTGAFQSLSVSDPGMENAGFFYTGSTAVAANPMENVYDVVAEDQIIQRVVGRTQLFFDVAFQVPQMEELRGCKHAFPWRYNVKRDDGVLVFARRYFLVVTPNATRPETAAWCAPVGLCI